MKIICSDIWCQEEGVVVSNTNGKMQRKNYQKQMCGKKNPAIIY